MTEPAYTRKESYVLKLHELLWQFIHQHDPQMTGVVDEVAEQVLADQALARIANSLSGPPGE
jgi:ABC-type cobalamin transport system ATPase subunit